MANQKDDKLRMWQERTEKADTEYEPERSKMDEREKIYRGKKEIAKIIENDCVEETTCPWNIAYELIEAQVDSEIPAPKVTALRKEDDDLARLIEELCRNKLDEQPTELANDQLERTVPKQGAGLLHIEWDAGYEQGDRKGRSNISFVHPKNLSPQPGITSDIEDMDWCGIDVAVTKSYIRRTFGVDVTDEEEAAPQLRGPDSVDSSNDLVTWRIRYFRNSEGGIGKFSYINDTVIEDYEDYQARKGEKCAKCGRPKPMFLSDTTQRLAVPTIDGTYPGGGEWSFDGESYVSEDAQAIEPTRPEEGVCPWCGSRRFVPNDLEYDEIWTPLTIYDDDGEPIMEIEGAQYRENDDGEMEYQPTKIPFYKPNMYPLMLMQNVYSWGSLLGESDIDKIAGQQNAINRLNQKMLDGVLKGGSVMTVPDDPRLDTSNGQMKVHRISNAGDREKFGVYTMEANIAQTVETMHELYQQARYTIGITDSYQGRQDTTATSGTAKQYSAAQAAGRFASKRVMKKYFWSRADEMLFKFELAYGDDPRPIVGRDKNGSAVDRQWNRWLFLRRNESTGEYYWNTDFLFSVDESDHTTNRQQLWKETQEFYASGALGPREDIGTTILFWRLMEQLHYPGAGEIKQQLIENQSKQSQLQATAALQDLEAQMETGGVAT